MGRSLAFGTSFSSDAQPIGIRPLPVISRLDTGSLALGWLFDRDVSALAAVVGVAITDRDLLLERFRRGDHNGAHPAGSKTKAG